MLSASPDVLMRVARDLRPRHVYKVICASKKAKNIFDCDEYWCRPAIFAVGRHLIPKLKYFRDLPDLNFVFDLVDDSGNYAEKIEYVIKACDAKVLMRKHYIPHEICSQELPTYQSGDLKCLARILCAMYYEDLCGGLPPHVDESLTEAEKRALELYGEPPASMKEIARREVIVDNINAKKYGPFDLYNLRKACRDIDDYFGADIELKRAYVEAFLRGLDDCVETMRRIPASLIRNYTRKTFKTKKGFQPKPLFRYLNNVERFHRTRVVWKFYLLFVMMKEDATYHQFDYELLYNHIWDIFIEKPRGTINPSVTVVEF